MNSKCALTLALVLFVSASVPSLAQQPTVDSLTRSSHIIFVGRFVKTEAVNLRVLTPSESTALVRVDELLDTPPSLVGIKGQEVTMELARPGGAKMGEGAVFFTNGILFGEHLEVKEVGRMPLPPDTSTLRQQISVIRALMDEERVKARVDSAALIVVGKVLETSPLKHTGPASEHQPDWAQAIDELL